MSQKRVLPDPDELIIQRVEVAGIWPDFWAGVHGEKPVFVKMTLFSNFDRQRA